MKEQEYLVLTNYKGNPSSIVISVPNGIDVYEFLKKKDIRGVEEIYNPGDWHYEPETLVAVPGQE
jgi:hypothetical protein